MTARCFGRNRGPLARAFTLVEMLVAMVLTLILVYAIAEFYAYLGDSVKDGRAMIELQGQLRSAVEQLKSDLDRITASAIPWSDDGGAPGYIEICEAANYVVGSTQRDPATDIDVNGNYVVDISEDLNNNGRNDLFEDLIGGTNLVGDGDDYIAFTIRSSGEPFTGRWLNPTTGQTQIINSQFAEVIWFTGFNDINGDGAWQPNELRKIYRRQLLIRPDLALAPSANPFVDNDISARYATPSWQTNSLAELAKRENRFAHQLGASAYPFPLLLNCNSTAYLMPYTLQGDSLGDDVVLSNVLAFDIRVFDPQAKLLADVPLSQIGNAINALAPGDPGYLNALASYRDNNPQNQHPQIGTGAYVDLGYGLTAFNMLTRPPLSIASTDAANALAAAGLINNTTGFYTGHFAGPPSFANVPNVGNTQTLYVAQLGPTYDTWTIAYERDGIPQFQVGPVRTDFGTNGLDDDNQNGVDDIGERETSPPFPRPLRGVQIRIRLYEPGTRQMRQATVTSDFVLE
jgi:prepilin-type N-terminal cleavage/methylation domain-containing protein